ncbi:MAG: HTH domain-containing protein [Alphaproteobacteria bacterium]|nr:HTH domain-containing protein [Alphaproteobacteria bacterium]
MMLVETSATSRVFIYMLGKFLQRMEQERRDLYFGDLDLARVMEVVSLASVEPGMRDAAFREKHSSLASIVGIDGQRATNATSIANATGIPRETIRRKLKQLQSLGVIIEKEPARYVVQPGILQQPERQEAFARGIRATVAFMNECLEQGVVRWVPKPVDGGQEG